MNRRYIGIYDFELMPYALGDVLTWNIQTAIRCENLGRDKVDVFICMDDRYPASIYQRGMITADNCGLFFNELFGAFGTHPHLDGLHVFRNRDHLLDHLHRTSADDPDNQSVIRDYEAALASRDNEAALNAYFTKYIYFHEFINAFSAKHGRIPVLQPSPGCAPDVAGLIARRLAGKRIVAIHTRLRRLDAGYGGEHTYSRDSDFVEWYEFLQEARQRFPDVVFIALGRLQEKPLEFLRLSNVLSLREYGLGLGHELTLMLRSDLFIGTSSGFAALANFSALPYFITRMNAESCNAYRIEFGADRLPFATDRQRLVYEAETAPMLMRLLEEGLNGVPMRSSSDHDAAPDPIDAKAWEQDRARWLHPGATTSRFFVDDDYADRETAYLLFPRLQQAARALSEGDRTTALGIVERLRACFPRVVSRLPEFSSLEKALAAQSNQTGPTTETAARCATEISSIPALDDRRYWAASGPQTAGITGLRKLMRWIFARSRSALRRIAGGRKDK